MKKLFTRIVCALSALTMLGALAACGEEASTPAAPHTEHTYSADWSKDVNGHWHAATCNAEDDCAEATKDFAEHTYNEGVCSVCGFVDDSYVPQYVLLPNADGEATVNVSGSAVEYKFVASTTDTYKFSWTNENLVVTRRAMPFASGTEMELVEGDSIVFVMSTADATSASYTVKVEVVEAQQEGNGKIAVGTPIEITCVSDNGAFMGTVVELDNVAEGTYTLTVTGADYQMYVDYMNADGDTTYGPELNVGDYSVEVELTNGYNFAFVFAPQVDASENPSVTFTVTLTAATAA